MSGLSFDEMNNWRKIAKEKLLKAAEYMGCNIKVINPVDYYNFEEKIYQSEKEVEEFDLKHVISSDIVIVNLDGLNTSDGTKIEIHDANYHSKIPVIAFGNIKLYEGLHPWVRNSITRIEQDIDAVIEYIKRFYMES